MTKPLRLRSNDVVWRAVGEEVVLLDLDRSSYLAANESASVLWELLAAGTDREQLVAKLVETYGIDEMKAGQDVDRLVVRLDEVGLLEK